jgi:hypothetical protein
MLSSVGTGMRNLARASEALQWHSTPQHAVMIPGVSTRTLIPELAQGPGRTQTAIVFES